jgi:RNA polymerase nonessential primary-like sigma factor
MKTLTTGESVSNAYLNEIGRVPLLTAEQEIDLGRKVRRAQELKAAERELTQQERREVALGERAERRFVRSNLRLVVSCAKKYSRVTRSLDLMDLVQEGNIGLITAVHRFDPSMGYKFSTFAYWWIRQGITRAISRKDSLMYMPGRISEMAATWGAKSQRLRAELGRAPTIAELAEMFNVTEHDVLLYMERGQAPMSLDVTTLDGSGATLMELVTDDVVGQGPLDQMVQEERIGLIIESLTTLPERDRDIVKRRLGLDGYAEQTLTEVSKAHGVSRERVRQIYIKATNRLKLYMHRVEREYVHAELPLLPVP